MVAAAAGSLLAQVAPTPTSAQLAYSNAELRTEITHIRIAAGATGATAKLYHDDAGGGSYVAGTMIHVVAVGANTTVEIAAQGGVGTGIMVKPGGQIAVETSVANELTFSIYGITAARVQE